VLVRALRMHMGYMLEIVGDDAGMHLAAFLPPGASDSREHAGDVEHLTKCSLRASISLVWAYSATPSTKTSLRSSAFARSLSASA
jgi:hypothetical protein